MRGARIRALSLNHALTGVKECTRQHLRPMPELAEVEYYRRQWDPGIGRRVVEVHANMAARDFRDRQGNEMIEGLIGTTLSESRAHGKQLLFHFSGNRWLGIHLGMTGRLQFEDGRRNPDRYEHLVIFQSGRMLIFSDFRQFGRVRYDGGPGVPEWWVELPPEVLSEAFNRDALRNFLQRHSRAAIKAVLLRQERFPGLGNWMADEILWRPGIKPMCPAGRIRGLKLSHLYREIRAVCRDALEVIAPGWDRPPDDWLFNHRWRDGGRCPRTGGRLLREKIGGRTTCWCPARQRWPRKLLKPPVSLSG